MCRCMDFFDERLGCAKDKCKVVAVTCDGGAEPCCQGAGELGSLSVCRCSAAPRPCSVSRSLSRNRVTRCSSLHGRFDLSPKPLLLFRLQVHQSISSTRQLVLRLACLNAGRLAARTRPAQVNHVPSPEAQIPSLGEWHRAQPHRERKGGKPTG
jgi:hypothetical protein